MKKILKLSSIIIILMFLIVSVFSPKMNAATNEGDIEVFFEGPTTIEYGTNEAVYTLRLGKFTNVKDGTIGIETTLEFDYKIFNSVELEEQPGWDLEYDKFTGRIVITADNPKANTDVLKFTFVVNKASANVSGDVYLNDFQIADDGNVDKKINDVSVKGIKITAPKSTGGSAGSGATTLGSGSGSSSGSGTQKDPTTYSYTSQTPATSAATTSSTSELSRDKGTATMALPKTGIRNIIIVSAILVVIAGIVAYIRSKSIKIK